MRLLGRQTARGLVLILNFKFLPNSTTPTQSANELKNVVYQLDGTMLAARLLQTLDLKKYAGVLEDLGAKRVEEFRYLDNIAYWGMAPGLQLCLVSSSMRWSVRRSRPTMPRRRRLSFFVLFSKAIVTDRKHWLLPPRLSIQQLNLLLNSDDVDTSFECSVLKFMSLSLLFLHDGIPSLKLKTPDSRDGFVLYHLHVSTKLFDLLVRLLHLTTRFAAKPVFPPSVRPTCNNSDLTVSSLLTALLVMRCISAPKPSRFAQTGPNHLQCDIGSHEVLSIILTASPVKILISFTSSPAAFFVVGVSHASAALCIRSSIGSTLRNLMISAIKPPAAKVASVVEPVL